MLPENPYWEIVLESPDYFLSVILIKLHFQSNHATVKFTKD